MKTVPFIGLLIISTITLAQDMTVFLNSYEQPYVIPVDTIPRNIYTSVSDYNYWEMEFEFPASDVDTIEYQIGGFISGLWDYNLGIVYDTLVFEITPFSEIDSVIVAPVLFNTDSVMSVTYMNYPGDSLSGFSVILHSESLNYETDYLQFWYQADTISDWSTMQPLAVGNVWKFHGPFTEYSKDRWEIIDEETVSDTHFYSVAREREYYNEGGGGALRYDTSSYYTIDSERYQIHHHSGDLIYDLRTDFSPIYDPQSTGLFEPFVLHPNGEFYFARWSESGPGAQWKRGVGFDASWGCGTGGGSTLTGYRIDGVTVGDIGNLVGVDPAVEHPVVFQLKAFPNPFNQDIILEFSLPEATGFEIAIFNIGGAKVWGYTSQGNVAGDYQIQWNARNDKGEGLPTGVYLIRTSFGDKMMTRKVLLLK